MYEYLGLSDLARCLDIIDAWNKSQFVQLVSTKTLASPKRIWIFWFDKMDKGKVYGIAQIRQKKESPNIIFMT